MSSARVFGVVFASAVVVSLMAACGSEGGSEFIPTDDGGTSGGTSGGNPPGQLPTPDVDGGSSGSSGTVDPNGCKKRTCADQNIECGKAGDGCGGIIECGVCSAGLRCGGPGALSKCVNPTVGTGCTPKTCADVGVACGPAGDGCGSIIQCGTCSPGTQCGGIGAPSQCVPTTVTGPDGGTCVPKTKADYLLENKDCGDQSDGCGKTINIGTCNTAAGEFCGGGGPSKCAVQGGGTCTKKTCNDYPGLCGPQSDNCGGVTANCNPCTAPETCGGGGVPSICGGGGVQAPDGGACVPRTVASCGAQECGTVADGCGGVIDCGVAKCVNGAICGGAGTPNQCGKPTCKPTVTACPAGTDCGSVADGCGGLIDCGSGATSCPIPGQICGGGGVPNKCGGGPGGGSCVPKTVAQACTANSCGPIADGCGGTVDCGVCTSPAICGGGGVASQCGGANQCTPKTVADCGTANCGFIADGCGGVVQCGATCPNGGVCGVTTPNVCSGGGSTCTGFCQQQDKTCAANSLTRISGKVWAPNGTRSGGSITGLPLPGALVYVPNGAATAPWGVTPITSGVTAGKCDLCNQSASGNPLVSTTTDANGAFTLTNVPAGVSFPVVIQLGKWRRMINVGPVTRCTNANLDGSSTNRPLARLPRYQDENMATETGNVAGINNIPLVAISTGQVDGLECVFRKLGLESSGANNTFGNPPGYSNSRGRIRLYRDNFRDASEIPGRNNAEGGARIDDNTPRTDSALTDTQAHLNQYDAVIFSCAGAQNDRTADTMPGILDRVKAYADNGGRVFATHFEYVYLYNTSSWNQTAAWDVPNARSSGDGSWTGQIDTSPGKRLLFSQWLNATNVKALSGTNPPRITITEARNNVDVPAAANAEQWITRYNDDADPTALLHYTFNTPTTKPADQRCGRVLFSDFHVSIGNTAGTTFPDECDTNDLTSQEKVLAFFLFDLTSCIETPTPPTCTKKTCSSYPAGTCGVQSDGCGGTTADCGACSQGQTCGGGGVLNQCGGPKCTPKTCAQLGANCGSVPDGCGNLIDCGPCTAPATCGGGGTAYQCGTPKCTASTCAAQGIGCGQTGDGCGNVLNCPTCPTGQTCGGGGTANQCGAPSCTPKTCPTGACGKMPNGCGGVLDCGNTCTAGQVCGGAGTPNQCGTASCTPKTCAQVGGQCGMVSDGCGGVATCPDCPKPGDFCNGQNVCVSSTCTPKTCAELGVACGPTADGCGGLVQCGDCSNGQGCGAGGVAGQCGTNPCTPKTCADLSAQCGQVANGCGGLTPDCGTCSGAQSCKNGICVDACTPRTCAAAGAQCGPIADGCGGIVDCGPCPNGQTCGFNNQANLCGSSGPK